ncbi:MAG: hypothetical protein ACLUEC_03945 [Coprococcus sp.]
MKKYSEKVSEDLVGAGIVAKGDKRVVAVFLVECLWEHGVAFR